MTRKDSSEKKFNRRPWKKGVNVNGRVLTETELLSQLDSDLFEIGKKYVQPTNEEQETGQHTTDMKYKNIFKKVHRRKKKQKAVKISDHHLLETAIQSKGSTASDDQELKQAQTDNQILVKGSIWLSVGNIISRLLGAAFILPWLAMLGVNANRSNALFSQGYTIYGILLAIATFGFPSAISKVLAQLMAKKDWIETRRLTRQSLWVGVILGLVFGLLLYVGAPFLSNGNPNVIPVLHSLAPAVLIFPLMSMMRGVFQGHQLMHISAISDIVEQIARIVYLLVMTIVVLNLDPNNWVGAVVQATFAAFIGALFSMVVLLWGWIKYRATIMPPAPKSKGSENRILSMVGHILKESWPFVVIGSATNLFLFVDQYTFFNIMKTFFDYSSDQLQIDFALFSANPNKLIMIVISFAISIATTALPLLSGSKEGQEPGVIQRQLDQVLRLSTLVLLPSALGMFAVANPLYKLFYTIDETSQAGIYLLQFSTIMTIVFSFFMLLSLVLQALSDTKIVMYAFGLGLVVKIVLQLPLVYAFQGLGALLASTIGMGISVAWMLIYLQKKYQVGLTSISEDLGRSFWSSVVMAVVAYLSIWIMQTYIFVVDTKLHVALETGVGVLVGAVILILLYAHYGLADNLLGSRFAKFIPIKKAKTKIKD
ncbi:putative polysaccharide biosynthesis protein [Convivina praedatoris]|uniref:Lipid II flippase MurJ n=1 Tax=Convivina praedatoris TaxID=2880963 RepID=A0ABN8H6V2_9LACO|nr:polysaccharide biosynthesis protein [Convivina sp. LMG 32447]CAH1850138.1 lipid II flippase MurJ [Convivina sp. LMG 32447]CAH1850144.1 lipid II flippase MurJ [Convivina sp. LMG 32447]CAH1851066.1 lipid II flippase MurJ [Convivina sp. LMG 32447]